VSRRVSIAVRIGLGELEQAVDEALCAIGGVADLDAHSRSRPTVTSGLANATSTEVRMMVSGDA